MTLPYVGNKNKLPKNILTFFYQKSKINIKDKAYASIKSRSVNAYKLWQAIYVYISSLDLIHSLLWNFYRVDDILYPYYPCMAFAWANIRILDPGTNVSQRQRGNIINGKWGNIISRWCCSISISINDRNGSRYIIHIRSFRIAALQDCRIISVYVFVWECNCPYISFIPAIIWSQGV